MDVAPLTNLIALGIGLLHALEPGHGKTALFTFLASGQKNWKDGVVISLSSAISHSLIVFIIAFISHYVLHHAITEDQIIFISEYLGIISGVMIICLGAWIIYKAKKGQNSHKHCCGGHHHAHEKDENQKSSFSNFFSSIFVGVATGIVPCPTVVVAYLSGVSSGHSYQGIQSVVFFAFGMFMALLGIVLLFNLGGQKMLNKLKLNSLKASSWSYVQGSVFIGIGLYGIFI